MFKYNNLVITWPISCVVGQNYMERLFIDLKTAWDVEFDSPSLIIYISIIGVLQVVL